MLRVSESDHFLREHADLLDALMRVMAQRSNEGRDGLLHHSGTPEEERAVNALTNAGFAVKKNGGYELLWGKLTERWLVINGKLSIRISADTKSILSDSPLLVDVDEVDVAHWNGEVAE